MDEEMEKEFLFIGEVVRGFAEKHEAHKIRVTYTDGHISFQAIKENDEYIIDCWKVSKDSVITSI